MITGTMTPEDFLKGRRSIFRALAPEQIRPLRIGRRLNCQAVLLRGDGGGFTGQRGTVNGPLEAHFVGYQMTRVGPGMALVVELRADSRTVHSFFALPGDLELVR